MTDISLQEMYNAMKAVADAVVEEKMQVELKGSHVGYSTEIKPTTGVNKGDDFLELDTGDVYIYDSSEWVMLP